MKALCAFVLAGAVCAGSGGGRADAWCDPESGPCGTSVSGSADVSRAAAAPSVSDEAAVLGLHVVTVVKVADERRTRGDTTTYTTTTTAMDAGTYAKKVASVGSGETSGYDVASRGERMTMSDGRAVAGDYYASYVVREGRLAFDRYVFFADDSERTRAATPAPTPAPSPRPSAPPPVTRVVVSPPPARTTPTPPPAFERPSPRPTKAPRRPHHPKRPRRHEKVKPPAPTVAPPASAVVNAAVALAPAGDELRAAEVLRGRPVELWLVATVDGAPAAVVRWGLLSGELVALGPVSGSGSGPLVATWHSVTGAGAPYSIRLRATVLVPGEGEREAEATIDVTVLAPAIVE